MKLSLKDYEGVGKEHVLLSTDRQEENRIALKSSSMPSFEGRP